MTKYKQYVAKMFEKRSKDFERFKIIHDKYTLDANEWQKEFNFEGEKILEIIREWEDRLCKNTERGMYSKYSTLLAEKFQTEIKKHFPMIDRIGIQIEDFNIKKIKLL